MYVCKFLFIDGCLFLFMIRYEKYDENLVENISIDSLDIEEIHHHDEYENNYCNLNNVKNDLICIV
jgi:hypothetical protein